MNNKVDTNNIGIILAGLFGAVMFFFLASIGEFLYGVFVIGFVGMKLWAWFVVPVFGLKALTITQAYGLSMIVGLWTHQYFVNTNKDERETAEKVGHLVGMLLTPWTTLFFGWLVHAFLM